MTTGRDLNFVFGVLRSREYQLLGRRELDALCDNDSIHGIVNQLPEGPFAAEVRNATNPDGVQNGMRAEVEQLKDLLAQFSSRCPIRPLVLTPWDVFNLKVAVLSKLREEDPDPLFGPEAMVPIRDLLEWSEELTFENLPHDLYDALQEAWIAYFEEDKSTQAFEYALDRQKDLMLRRYASDCPADVSAFVGHAAELRAAQNLVRCHVSGVGWNLARWTLQEFPAYDVVAHSYALPVRDWQMAVFSDGPFKRVVGAYAAGEPLDQVFVAEKNMLYASMEQWKYRSATIEYIYYFVAQKLTTLYNLRLVLIGRMNHIPAGVLRERIIDVYV
jgi:vacuolar-type H+-ATPase subunit C/Vma6